MSNAIQQIPGLSKELNRTANIKEWKALEEYRKGDIVLHDNCIYICLAAHTSYDTFEDYIGSGYIGELMQISTL